MKMYVWGALVGKYVENGDGQIQIGTKSLIELDTLDFHNSNL